MSQIMVGVDAEEGQILLSCRQLGGEGDGASSTVRIHPRGARSLAATLDRMARELDEDATPAELVLKGDVQVSNKVS